MMKIAITARNYSTQNPEAAEMLRAAGLDIADFTALQMGVGTPEADVISAIGDADLLIAGVEPISAEVLRACPRLRFISRRGIGYDAIDIAACTRAGIRVARTTGVVEGAVAEHVMAFLLCWGRDIAAQNAVMHTGVWNRVLMPGIKGRRLGLFGFGGIGKEIAKRAVPFGMQVFYTCRHPDPRWDEEYHVTYVDRDTLFHECDYISLNVPLSSETRGLIGAHDFSLMKPDAVFINISRAPLVNEPALKQALEECRIRGACIDVFDHEPCTDSIFLNCPNVILTPHTASFTAETFTAMNITAAQNVLDFLSGSLKEKMLVN